MDKPLRNRKIIITRDKNKAIGLANALETFGADCLVFPTIKISATEDWTECDRALQEIKNYQWIIFSSANGIRYFLARASKLNSTIDKNNIGVVGKKTLRELESFGLKADLIPGTFSAAGLIKSFKQENIAGNKILLPTSEIARDELQTGLEGLGADVNRINVYRNECRQDQSTEPIINAIDQNYLDAVIFFSPSAFICFTKILGPEVCSNLKKTKAVIAAIGLTTTRAIELAGFNVGIIPEKGTEESMVQAIVKYFENRN